MDDARWGSPWMRAAYGASFSVAVIAPLIVATLSEVPVTEVASRFSSNAHSAVRSCPAINLATLYGMHVAYWYAGLFLAVVVAATIAVDIYYVRGQLLLIGLALPLVCLPFGYLYFSDEVFLGARGSFVTAFCRSSGGVLLAPVQMAIFFVAAFLVFLLALMVTGRVGRARNSGAPQ